MLAADKWRNLTNIQAEASIQKVSARHSTIRDALLPQQLEFEVSPMDPPLKLTTGLDYN